MSCELFWCLCNIVHGKISTSTQVKQTIYCGGLGFDSSFGWWGRILGNFPFPFPLSTSFPWRIAQSTWRRPLGKQGSFFFWVYSLLRGFVGTALDETGYWPSSCQEAHCLFSQFGLNFLQSKYAYSKLLSYSYLGVLFPPPPTQRDMAKYICTQHSHDSRECILYHRLQCENYKAARQWKRVIKMDSPFPHNFISVEYFHFREFEKFPSTFTKHRNIFFLPIRKEPFLLYFLILNSAGATK